MAQMKKPTPLKPKAQVIAERAAAAKKKPAPIKPKVRPATTPKPRIVQMPEKISPSKMTPAQKARYLKNPERYDY